MLSYTWLVHAYSVAGGQLGLLLGTYDPVRVWGEGAERQRDGAAVGSTEAAAATAAAAK